MELGIEIGEEMTDFYVPAGSKSSNDASTEPSQLLQQSGRTHDDFDADKTDPQVGAKDNVSSKDLPDVTHKESIVSNDDGNSRAHNALVCLSNQDRDACYGQSTMELGIEIGEEMTDFYVP